MIVEGKTRLVLPAGEYTYSGDYFPLKTSIMIYGQGHEKTTLAFSLRIKGKKSDGTVEISDLKIKEGKGTGLVADNGMDVVVRRCTIEKCGNNGVAAERAYLSCIDLRVVGCRMIGVFAVSGGTIKMSGEDTRIHNNVTCGDSDAHGLQAGQVMSFSSSSKILLVAPLTKEKISTNNGGGGNWGGRGDIIQVPAPAGETKSNPTTDNATTVSLIGL